MNELDFLYDQKMNPSLKEQELYWGARNTWFKLVRSPNPLNIFRALALKKKFDGSYRGYRDIY